MTTTVPSIAPDAPVLAAVSFGSTPLVSSRGIACDRCPTAPAKARVSMPTGDLYLCGHHVRTAWDTLSSVALSIEVDTPADRFFLPQSEEHAS